MSTIRIIYHPKVDGSFNAPNFPATDQHPSAVRYQFVHPSHGNLTIDAIGGAPVQAEIDVLLSPPVLDKDAEARKAIDADPAAPPNVDLFKLIRAKAISDLAFRLGVAPGALTPAQIATERARLAAIYAAL